MATVDLSQSDIELLKTGLRARREDLIKGRETAGYVDAYDALMLPELAAIRTLTEKLEGTADE